MDRVLCLLLAYNAAPHPSILSLSHPSYLDCALHFLSSPANAHPPAHRLTARRIVASLTRTLPAAPDACLSSLCMAFAFYVCVPNPPPSVCLRVFDGGLSEGGAITFVPSLFLTPPFMFHGKAGKGECFSSEAEDREKKMDGSSGLNCVSCSRITHALGGEVISDPK